MKTEKSQGIPAGKRVKRSALSVMIRSDRAAAAEEHVEAADAGDDMPANKRAGQASANDQLATEIALSVGWEIRNLRLSVGLAAQDLAKKAGISNGMLSKLERGQATASFATLGGIAKALEVPVSRLFASHDKRSDYSLVRSGRGVDVHRRGSKHGMHYRLLGHLLSGEKYVEPYLVRLDEGAQPSPGFQHTGLEFMYMLSGKMTFRFAEDLIDLNPGDTLVFDANNIHGHEKLIEPPVFYLSVVFNLRN